MGEAMSDDRWREITNLLDNYAGGYGALDPWDSAIRDLLAELARVSSVNLGLREENKILREDVGRLTAALEGQAEGRLVKGMRREGELLDAHPILACCRGERCRTCGAQAHHKIGEEMFEDDPQPIRHNLTAYLCCRHFREIMGGAGTPWCQPKAFTAPIPARPEGFPPAP